MCTMSIIRTREDVLRIAFNRDELNSRPAGLPPRIEQFGEHQAILPRDSQAGGTWLAANDSGLVLGLLNATRAFSRCAEAQSAWAKGPCHASISRGSIIPRLLRCRCAAEAVELASGLQLNKFAAFRLIAIDRDSLGQLIHSDCGTDSSIHPLGNAEMFTSSGLGDHLVQYPRARLFEEMVEFDPTAVSQDAFHRHRWADRPHLSIDMSRTDARTVSFTTIEMQSSFVAMQYRNGNVRSACVQIPMKEAVLA